MSSSLHCTLLPFLMASRLVLTRAHACVYVCVSLSLFPRGIFGKGVGYVLGSGCAPPPVPTPTPAGCSCGPVCLVVFFYFPASAGCSGLPRTQTFRGRVNLESMLFASVLCWGIRKQPACDIMLQRCHILFLPSLFSSPSSPSSTRSTA